MRTAVFRFLVPIFLVAALLAAGWQLAEYKKKRAATGTLPQESEDPAIADYLAVPGILENYEAELVSEAGAVVHHPSGKMLAGKNAFKPRSIASITKLMSAIIVLEQGVDLEEVTTVRREEFTIGGNLRIVPDQETVTGRDLLYSSITGSANNAANALARMTGLEKKEFVREMNRRAVELGLESMHFVDPSGISPKNKGSAYDAARLAAVVFNKHPLIKDAAARPAYKLATRNTGREHEVKNPNTLFERRRADFSESKTGYLNEAGYCLVLVKENEGEMIIAVTLGSPSKQSGEDEALSLLKMAEGRVAGLAQEEN